MTADEFEVRGEWWLPSRNDRRVPGILTFSPEDGAELSLFGNLRSILEEGDRTEQDGTFRISLTQAALERSGSYPLLHGDGNGNAYTLQDCLRVSASNRILSSQGSETIRVTRILKGASFEEDEALEATGISFGLANLVDWIGETGISEEWRDADGTLQDVPRFRVEAREKPDRRADLANGGTVYLKHSVGITGDGMSNRALTQGFHWRVDQAGMASLDDLLDLASDLQDLVSIATDRTAAFESVRFWHPDVYREMRGGARMPEAIDLFVVWNTKAERPVRRLHEHSLLFTFEHLGGIDGVSRWMDAAARHRGGLGRVMATRYAKEMFVSDRLLNCTAALEAFDRDSTQLRGSNLKTRLQRCVALAGNPFANLVGDVDRWAETVRLERNDVAHHFGRRMRTSGSEIYYLWQSLYWLYVMCILRDSGAPEEVFNHLQGHSQYQWLIPHIQAVV
jgi:ApeA N-terminal domain 1